MSNRATALCMLLGLVALGLGARPVAAADEAVEVAARLLGENAPVVGRIGALEDTSLRLLTAAGPRTLAWEDVVSLEVAKAASPARETRPPLRLHLVGGEVVLGTYVGPIEDGLSLETPEGIAVGVRYDQILSLVTVPSQAGLCYEPEMRLLPRESGDVLYTQGGDALEGLLLGIDGEGVRIEGERGLPREVAWADVQVLHLENEALGPLEGTSFEIETVGGTRWQAPRPPALAGPDTLRVTPRSLPGVTIPLPLAQVRALRPSGGRFVYACDLPFESRHETPYGQAEEDGPEAAFLEAWYGARVDRRPSGCPLRLAGRTYRHGFGVHARSTLTLALDGAYERFVALFGVDDEAAGEGPGGVVDARVLADGRVMWQAEAVRVGEEPRSVGPIDVRGVQRLVLEVDFGPDLHVRDRATWAEPILVRATR